MIRPVAAACAVGALALSVLVPASIPHTAAAEALPPSPWPDTALARPRLDATAHTLRLSGPDRYQTGLAAALTLRGQGGYPFTTPDRSSGGATTLGGASQWWGARTCPRSIIIVAGDSPADALAAATLSDPTGNSSEPFLQRTAAADPLFDPPGGFARVDTDSAPVLITRSARQGATALTPATRIAAQDLRAGGCTTARQAIVVGGTSAVPAAVDAELVSIGYDEVFRVAGANRYDTAALIARALGTAGRPAGTTTCTDPRADDGAVRMAWYANSVIEYRPSASDCRLLGRTVVVADGVVGADALAAGWWTGFWQVPLLLHDGSDSLPTATVEALTTMDVHHLILLGGTARLSTTVAAQAAAVAEAEVIRVAGADRYATSVEMARRFGGWFPSATGAEFASSMLCVAASSGSGASAQGWPDALTAGPLCAAMSGAAGDPRPPVRALGPVTGTDPRLTSTAASNGHDAVPILLVPHGSATLPAGVAQLLADAFTPSATWCSSATTGACVQPGFAVVFGGTSAVPPAMVAEINRLVSGRPDAGLLTTVPTLTDAFGTELDLSPVFATTGTGTARVCAPRAAVQSARWLAVFTTAAATRSIAAADVMIDGRYRRDGDTTVRSPGTSAPVCVAHDPTQTAGATQARTVRAVGPNGQVSATRALPSTLAERFAMSGALNITGPTTSSGIDSDLDPSTGGVTTARFTTTASAITLTFGTGDTAPTGTPTVAATVTASDVTLTLTRGVDAAPVTAPDLVTGTFSLASSGGTFSGTIIGEAILAAGVWEIRGMATVTDGTGPFVSGRGGFRASWTVNTAGNATDDALSWRMDAFRGG